jgi:hypothetical protein
MAPHSQGPRTLPYRDPEHLPLSVICSGGPIGLDKPHILALAAETGNLPFKEQAPQKIKKRNIRGSMGKGDLSTDITFNPC